MKRHEIWKCLIPEYDLQTIEIYYQFISTVFCPFFQDFFGTVSWVFGLQGQIFYYPTWYWNSCRNGNSEAHENAQNWRVWTTLAEDLSSVLSIHMRYLTTTITLAPDDLTPFSGLLRNCTHMNLDIDSISLLFSLYLSLTHIHTINKIF